MRRVVALASLALACGDNLGSEGVPLAQTAELVIVAHPDDDVLLLQPDVLEAIHRGEGVTTVYVTAGNGAEGRLDAAQRRYDGIKSAYGFAAGATGLADWHCGTVMIHAHSVEHCRLAPANLSLVFFGYPDGGKQGEFAPSLLHLWQGTIDSAVTIAPQPTRFDRDGLIATTAEIIREVEPSRVRTLEVAGTHGRDHADHVVVGALTVLALAAANKSTELLAYRGYTIGDEPANKVAPIFDASLGMLARYEACATDCAPCGEACTTVDDQHATWLARRYAVGFRRVAGGQLRSGNQCLNEALAMVSCSVAPIWKLDTASELRARDLCLSIGDDGALSMETCTGGPARHFIVDDEGHVFAGIAPPVSPAASNGALWCLVPPAPGSPPAAGATLARCATPDAPTWELVPVPVETTRATLGITSTGREVRLGDIDGDHRADLCAIETGLLCSHGLGNGKFDTATRIDSIAQPLAIEPRSLVLGDVDGDGRTDACGRDGSGILCATFAQGFAAERWTPAFAATSELPTTSASLAAIDADGDGTAELCGVDGGGVLCAKPGLMLLTQPRSTWPEPSAVVWLADLDGDGDTDWCAATSTGPACAVFAQSDLTSDGAPWGYAHAGIIDIAPANTATVAFGDIDGDRRADYCVPREDRIVCARSQGRAFGPRATTVAILPNQSTASALWLGDLDGDGRMDPCADTGATIACAVQP
jgi:LmbE family N-acetylglucosaminyl deacetylase